MATTREVRRGAWWLRLHQFVLLRSRRNIRSTIGNVEFSSEQHETDPGGHECRHQSEPSARERRASMQAIARGAAPVRQG